MRRTYGEQDFFGRPQPAAPTTPHARRCRCPRCPTASSRTARWEGAGLDHWSACEFWDIWMASGSAWGSPTKQEPQQPVLGGQLTARPSRIMHLLCSCCRTRGRCPPPRPTSASSRWAHVPLCALDAGILSIAAGLVVALSHSCTPSTTLLRYTAVHARPPAERGPVQARLLGPAAHAGQEGGSAQVGTFTAAVIEMAGCGCFEVRQPQHRRQAVPSAAPLPTRAAE